MANWFHKLLNPHCEHCADELIDKEFCSSCETLRAENARLIRYNEKLLDSLLTKNSPELEIKSDIKDIQPIGPKYIPWRLKKQLLETESRNAADILKRKMEEIQLSKTDDIHVVEGIEELEKEVLNANTRTEA